MSDSLEPVKKTFNMLTGKTTRQARAYRAISEWSETVHKFLTTYDLYGSHRLNTLIDKIGNAKFDLVGISHNGRPLVAQAKAFKGTSIPDNVEVILAGADSIRRYLIDPDLRQDHLSKAIVDLRVDYENLRESLEREYQRLSA